MLIRGLIYLIGAYLALLLFAYLFADFYIFYPPKSTYKDSQNILKIKTRDGATISAIYLPNKNAKYTILVSHGNAEDLGTMLPFLEKFKEQGFAVFAYDYHGYGTSEGRATAQSTYADVDAAYDYLTQKLQVPPDQIISYGRSVGAALAIDLAARKPVAAVIAESPFTSAFTTLTQIKLFPFDKYDNLAKIKKIKVPILLIHGTSDTTIFPWHSKKLYEAANAPKSFYWVKGAGHNDVLLIAGPGYWGAIKKFANSIS